MYGTGPLLEASRSVRDMQGTPGWQFLHGLIEVEIERVQTQMLNSSLPSYEKLAQLQGELRGLKVLADSAQTVLDCAQEREAEEQQLAEASHGGSI